MVVSCSLSSQLMAASYVLHVVLRCRRRSKSTGTHSQYASWFGVHRSRSVARRSCNPTHACCCEHGRASVRNQFSRLHWPRGRSNPGSWMVGSLTLEELNSVLKETSTTLGAKFISNDTHTCQPSVIRTESPSFWHR